MYRYFKRAVCGYEVRGRKVPGALPATKHRIRWHDFEAHRRVARHRIGAHPKLISARLGHSTITITLDRYGHLFPSVEEALAEASTQRSAPSQSPPRRTSSRSRSRSSSAASVAWRASAVGELPEFRDFR